MDRAHISKIESGNIGLPEEPTRERFHKVFGSTEQELIDLGIVPQFDEWGRPVKRDQAPAYANPFPADDPRHRLTQVLIDVDLKGPNGPRVISTIIGLTDSLIDTISTKPRSPSSLSPIDTKTKS